MSMIYEGEANRHQFAMGAATEGRDGGEEGGKLGKFMGHCRRTSVGGDGTIGEGSRGVGEGVHGREKDGPGVTEFGWDQRPLSCTEAMDVVLSGPTNGGQCTAERWGGLPPAAFSGGGDAVDHAHETWGVGEGMQPK